MSEKELRSLSYLSRIFQRESVEALIVGSLSTQNPDGRAYDILGSGGSLITVFTGLWSSGRDGSHSIFLRRLLIRSIRLFSIYSSDLLQSNRFLVCYSGVFFLPVVRVVAIFMLI